MRRYYLRLILKKLFINLPLQFFSMVTMVIIFSVSVALLCFGLNMVDYSKNYFKDNMHYQQLTFVGTSEDIDLVLMRIDISEYSEARTIYSSIYQPIDNDETHFGNVNLEVGVYTKEYFLFATEKISKFKSITEENEASIKHISLTNDYATYIASLMSVDIESLVGKKITISNGSTSIDYIVHTIFNEKYTSLIRQYTSIGIFVNDMAVASERIILTVQFSSMDNLKEAKVRNEAQSVRIVDNIATIDNITSYTSILFIIATICSLILLLSIIGLMNSSIQTTFIDDLPFYSLLKILGISDRHITLLLTFKTFLTVNLSYFISLLGALFVLHVSRELVDIESLLGIYGRDVMRLNTLGITTIFSLITLINIVMFIIMSKHISKSSIDQYYISELNQS